MHRLLSVDDFLRVASEATGIPEEEIDTESVQNAAKRALDRAGTQRRKRGVPVAVHKDIAAKGCAMTHSLLRDPPLPHHAGHVAYACLSALLERNGARWTAPAPMTILRFEEEARLPAGAQEFAQFIEAHIEREQRSRARKGTGRQSSLFSQEGPRPLKVGVMLSNPYQTLDQQERATLQEIEPAVRGALQRAEQRLQGELQLQLHHPSTTIPKQRPRISARELWEWVGQLLREEVDALIVCEVGQRCAGFGSAIELDQHVLQDGALVYLHRRGCEPRSRYVDGRRHELGFKIIEYEELEKLTDDLARWVLAHTQKIEASARRRRDRRRMYSSLRRRLYAAWHKAQPQDRELAADAAGMNIEEVQRMLTSALEVATLPAHRLDTICRMLGVSRDERRVAGEPTRRSGAIINYGALLQAAAEQGWAASTMFAARDRAERMRSQAIGHRARLRLASPADWIRFRHACGL
jgi:hypothetical protein